ncbi:MAG: CHAT domain-containing protein [Gemmatimonadaceae bacterium]
MRWQSSEASTLLLQVASAAGALRAPRAEAEALLALQPLVSRALGSDSARSLLRRAEALASGLDEDQLLAIRCARGAAWRQLNPQRSDTLLRAAIEDAERLGAPRLVGRCRLAFAQTLEALGRPKAALEAIAPAAAALQRGHDLHTLASAEQFTAYLHAQYNGSFWSAKSAADHAIRAANESGNALVVPWAQLNLAQAALRVGDAALAIRLARNAEPALRSLGDRSGLAATSLVLGDASYIAGQLDAADSAYLRAVEEYTELRFDASRAYGMFQLASTAIDRGNVALARRRLDDGLALATQRRLTGYLRADQYYLRGRVDLLAGDYESASSNFRRFRETTGDAVHFRYDTDMRIAEALARRGRFDDAAAYFDRGTLGLDAWRGLMTSREQRIAMLQGRRKDFDTDLGLAAIVGEFASAGRVAQAFHIAEQERARHVWLQLERRNALLAEPADVDPRRRARVVQDPSSIDSVRAAVPDGTALIEFVSGRGREPTTAFVVSREGVHAVRLPQADSLVEPIARLSRALESGLPGTGLARMLGGAILDPLLTHIGNADRLVVIPDGPLHRLPFDALRLSTGQAVVERYSVVLAPSARIALEWWRAPAVGRDRAAVVFADPRPAPGSGRAALPYARREARAVAAAVPRSVIAVGADASEARLKRSDWPNVGLLHVAAHAEVEEFGLTQSAFYLADGSGEDGRVGVDEISQLPLSNALVVLSACRTLGGVVANGEGLQGLTAPFLEAGARALVATLWPVSDRGMATLMEEFYRQLGGGASVDRAARAAKLRALRHGTSPALWATLVVVGDGTLAPITGSP